MTHSFTRRSIIRALAATAVPAGLYGCAATAVPVAQISDKPLQVIMPADFHASRFVFFRVFERKPDCTMGWLGFIRWRAGDEIAFDLHRRLGIVGVGFESLGP